MASPAEESAIKRFFIMFIPGLFIPFALILYVTWYRQAVSGASPYDPMFIEVNLMMPEPARAWACGKIAKRFPGALPPHSC